MSEPANILSAAEIRDILEYDPETGIFIWKRRVGTKTPAGAVAGSGGKFCRIQIANKDYRAHVLAWILTYGKPSRGGITHIDGNVRNNRIANLRDTIVGEAWSPIETAPKDGTVIDLWVAGVGRVTDVHYDADVNKCFVSFEAWHHEGWYPVDGVITHWMPVPLAPK